MAQNQLISRDFECMAILFLHLFSPCFSHEVLKSLRSYRINVCMKSALPSRFCFQSETCSLRCCKPCWSNKMTEFQSSMPCMFFFTKKLENKHVVFFFRNTSFSSGFSRGVVNLKKSKKNWLLVKLKISDKLNHASQRNASF